MGMVKHARLLFHTFIQNNWHTCLHFLHNNNKPRKLIPCIHTVWPLFVSLFSFLLLLLSKLFLSINSGFPIYFSLFQFCISFLTCDFIITLLSFHFFFPFFLISFPSLLLILFQAWFLNFGPTRFPKTPVTKYQTTLRNILALEDCHVTSVTKHQTTLNSSWTLEDGTGRMSRNVRN